jgi:PAS domain S-box-containing protein
MGEGIFYDSRSVLISVTAMVFGFTPAIISAIAAVIYRLLIGGTGVLPGLFIILASLIIGLGSRYVYNGRSPRIRYISVYLSSILLHCALIAGQFSLLPLALRSTVLEKILTPFVVVYPIAALSLSYLLFHQQERQTAIKQRQEAEGRYRSLFDNNHAIMLLINYESGRIFDANPAAISYYGWSHDEITEMNISEINTLSLHEIKIEMQKSVNEERSHFNFRHRKADGSIRDVEVFSGPIYLNNIKMLYSIVHDVSDRVTAENKLIESELRFRTVVEGAPDAIYIQSNGQFTFLNKAAVELFGANDENQLLNTSIYDRFHPDNHVFIKSRIESLLQTQEIAPAVEELFIRLDGSMVEVEVVAVPLNIDDQKGILVFCRDISHRKSLENEKKAIEEQLRQQQKLEAIGTLAGGVAHEINNPINGIMNYAQLVLDNRSNDSEDVMFLNGIISETMRVSGIVRNLLQFSRQEKQAHSYANVQDIIDQTVSLIKTIFKKDQIVIDIELSDKLPQIKCRSQQVQQVLMNLLTNARDALNEKYKEYNPNKIIRLTCTSYVKSDRTWITISVHDNGVGIPSDKKEKVFEPFYSTKPKEIGTGLGMSISYGIVRDHHGFFEIDSEPNKYTNVTIHLPADNGWDETNSLIQ